jgi:Cyclophilin type peptidyl-prolyl cis-trans isomerase/CLD
VTLHTTLGDLKLEIFCDEVPRTAENFMALAASGYYDSTKFHRCAARVVKAPEAAVRSLTLPLPWRCRALRRT